MKPNFEVIVGIDVVFLLLPTARAGAWGDFGIAVALASMTVVLWIWLRVSADA
jgi:hypothetical protein